METFTQEYKDRIFEQANEHEIFIRVGQRKYPARIYGKKLTFPFVRSEKRIIPVSSEVSWYVVERLAYEEINTVIYEPDI